MVLLMKKFFIIIFMNLLLSGNAYSDDKKLYEMTQNKLNMMKYDQKRDLSFIRGISKGGQEEFCKSPINRTINFNVAHKNSVDSEKWGCLSGNCDKGEGVYRTHGGFTYSGNFEFGRLTGPGIVKFKKVETTGKATVLYSEFINGCAHGKGKLITYKGEHIDLRFEYNKAIIE